MREILFRGKRKDNAEWIEGYLVKLGRESFSDPERYGICNKAVPLGGSGVFYNLKIDEIIPETVGEFTGMTDKNGTEIFEGDIIQTKPNYKLLIKYGEYIPNDFCQFKYKDRKSFGLFATDGKDDFQMSNHSYLFEVIGNIHDNPELLKGGVE